MRWLISFGESRHKPEYTFLKKGMMHIKGASAALHEWDKQCKMISSRKHDLVRGGEEGPKARD